MSKELANYAAAIVTERGITKESMTKEIMGEVLKEALRRMDKAVTRLLDSTEFCSVMGGMIYHSARKAG